MKGHLILNKVGLKRALIETAYLSILATLVAVLALGVGLAGVAQAAPPTPTPTPTDTSPPELTDIVAQGDYRVDTQHGEGDASGLDLHARHNPKLESVLGQIAEAYKDGGKGRAQKFAAERGVDLTKGRVRVALVTQLDDAMALADDVKKTEARVETSYRSLLQVLAPIPALERLAALPQVAYVRQPAYPQQMVASEGVTLTHATDWQAASYDGSGAKVAIINLGFGGYSSLLGTELPASVTTQNFRADGDFGADVEGTACAEIVYDMAPGAQMYLVAFSTEVEFYQAVDYVIAQGVDIVSSSVGWTTTGPYDGTDGNLSWGYQINQKVSEARAAGIFWAQSAGNFRDGHYEGTFSGVSVGPYTLHSFGGSITWVNQLGRRYRGQSVQALLSWDNWSAPVDQDYDLWVLGYPGSGSTWYILAASQDYQNGGTGQFPREIVQYQVPGNRNGWYFGVAIRRYSTTHDGYLELYSYDNYSTPDFEVTTQGSSLCIPADNPDAVTSGATNVSDDSLEYFSSEGPTNGPGGVPAGGSLKPDLTGPDRVSTVTYGSGAFAGTSAASPHVAGAAALVKGVKPSYTPAQIQAFLEARALDLGSPGKDNLFGAGRLELADAVPPAAITDQTISQASNDALLSWSPVTLDINGDPEIVDHYTVYRSTEPYFVPTVAEAIATTAGTTYTDSGAIGDPSQNYYYVVTAVDLASNEAAVSNRVGEHDFAMTPGSGPGDYKYNLIALPLEVASITDADSLASYVGGVYIVIRYDAATQGVTYWLPDYSAGTNFPVQAGGPYYLYLKDTASTVTSFVGDVPAEESVTFNLVPGSGPGDYKYNAISVPLDRGDISNADELAADIGGVYMVIRYDAATQGVTYWLPDYSAGTNFPILIGSAYKVYLKDTAPTTWPSYP